MRSVPQLLFSSLQLLPYCMFRQLKHIGKYALRQGCIFLKTKRHTYRNAAHVQRDHVQHALVSVHAYDSPRGHRIYALVHYARVRLILVDIVTKKLLRIMISVVGAWNPILLNLMKKVVSKMQPIGFE